ncbi:MAG TPA: protease HtpX, partial [bacterium]|nr:protease HtpX [bacterium]
MNNTLRTAMLLGLLTGLLILIGGYLGGQQGMVIAFVVAGLMNFASYWFSDKIVLMMYRAKQLEPRDHPTLFSTVERLT